MAKQTAVTEQVDAVVVVRSTRMQPFAQDAQITVVIEDNPYEEGSVIFDEFEMLRTGMTVAQAMKRGVSRRTLWWSNNKGYIAVREARTADNGDAQ